MTHAPSFSPSSADRTDSHYQFPAPPAGRGALATTTSGRILSERWPVLSRALSHYQQGTAETFSQLAYDRVDAGLIRLDHRKQLAHEAHAMGIRDFDAQLLIACAVRQWSLDHHYDATPAPSAPALSFEYKAWGRVWQRLAIVGGFALALDILIIWKWLS